MRNQKFYESFGVPECGYHVADYMVSEDLQRLSAEVEKEEFSAKWAGDFLGISEQEAEKLLQKGFREGLINKAFETTEENRFLIKDGYYSFNTFYYAVSIFAVLHNQEWISVAGNQREELMDWNINEFCRLNHDAIAEGSRTDEVHTLQQAIEFVQNKSDDTEFTVQNCDCRSLYQRCEKDLDVCIHMSPKDNPYPNAPVARGYGRVITREEVIDILKRSSKQGLMQTYNEKRGGAICNCCGCCCFEFQGGQRMPDVEYPKRIQIAKFDESECVGCGLCTKRCHFDAFEKKDGKIIFYPEKCYGCGVCAVTCPKKCIDIVSL